MDERDDKQYPNTREERALANRGSKTETSETEANATSETETNEANNPKTSKANEAGKTRASQAGHSKTDQTEKGETEQTGKAESGMDETGIPNVDGTRREETQNHEQSKGMTKLLTDQNLS